MKKICFVKKLVSKMMYLDLDDKIVTENIGDTVMCRSCLTILKNRKDNLTRHFLSSNCQRRFFTQQAWTTIFMQGEFLKFNSLRFDSVANTCCVIKKLTRGNVTKIISKRESVENILKCDLLRDHFSRYIERVRRSSSLANNKNYAKKFCEPIRVFGAISTGVLCPICHLADKN